MALSCGFFNSNPSTHDRKYDATQISALFDGVISDGVFATVGKAFVVKASTTDQTEVIVQTGRAWFNHTWSLNDADIPMKAPDPGIFLDRIDALVLDVNNDVTVRDNTLVWVQGTEAAENPQKPELISVDTHHQYPLCYIYRKAGEYNISQTDIENTVGTSLCPFVTGLIDTIDASELLLKWDAEMKEFAESQEAGFIDWWNSLRIIMDGDVAGHLQNEIDELKEDVTDLQTESTAHGNAISGLNMDVNAVREELTANNKQIYMDYQNGKYGINTDPERGADTFIPFKGFEYLGTSASYDLSGRADYKKLTNDNFKVLITSIWESGFTENWSSDSRRGSFSGSVGTPYPTYDPNTGRLTINRTSAGAATGCNCTSNSLSYGIQVYLFY